MRAAYATETVFWSQVTSSVGAFHDDRSLLATAVQIVIGPVHLSLIRWRLANIITVPVVLARLQVERNALLCSPARVEQLVLHLLPLLGVLLGKPQLVNGVLAFDLKGGRYVGLIALEWTLAGLVVQ
ncbi:MAG: hypothetical protein U9R25_19500 [Chloroflexota bacterium]|nr:hypothetical protein [Chloroflexota bacterium]